MAAAGAEAVILYERLADRPGGARLLAQARLKRRVREVMVTAENETKTDDSMVIFDALPRNERRDLTADRLWDSITSLAGYLHDLGYELTVELVPAGQPRAEVLRQRTESEN